MEIKFTPGPWIPDPDDVCGESLVVMRCSNGCHVAEAYTMDRPGECEANAHLIAAAPDLYHTLETLTTYCELKGIPTDAAYAALAKARGEQP